MSKMKKVYCKVWKMENGKVKIILILEYSNYNLI